ncbi:hypothetical protein CsSME_00015651 [Camellia sinensis var. sinensis]
MIYTGVDEDFGERYEEATRGGGGNLGGVDGGDHEGIANADAGDEAADHEEGVAGGEAHEDGSHEEDSGGEDDGVPAPHPIGCSACGGGTEEGVDVEDAHQDFQLGVRDLQVLLDERSCSAHHPNICTYLSPVIFFSFCS